MTLEQFAQMFALLAVQLRFSDADEATIRGYYEAVKDLEPEFVAMAAERMGKQGGAFDGDNRHWFPKSSEWRTLAGTIEGERAELVAKHVREYHKVAKAPLCAVCDDSGWQAITDGSVSRWRHCECRRLRRLEVLGRRPMPLLPERAGA